VHKYSGGSFFFPVFIFLRARLDIEIKKDILERSFFDAQLCGWITSEEFLKWLKALVRSVNHTLNCSSVTIIDCHVSNKNLDVMLFTQLHHMCMMNMPTHTTCKIQPPDHTIMKPVENTFDEVCAQWLQKCSNLKISVKNTVGNVTNAFTVFY
jgi:hypothetical protein